MAIGVVVEDDDDEEDGPKRFDPLHTHTQRHCYYDDEDVIAEKQTHTREGASIRINTISDPLRERERL